MTKLQKRLDAVSIGIALTRSVLTVGLGAAAVVTMSPLLGSLSGLMRLPCVLAWLLCD